MIGIALIGSPKVIFLDEPSAGVDPFSRRRLRDIILSQVNNFVILTTHVMEEADLLCTKVAFQDEGMWKHVDSPENIKKKFGASYKTVFHLPYIQEESFVKKYFHLLSQSSSVEEEIANFAKTPFWESKLVNQVLLEFFGVEEKGQLPVFFSHHGITDENAFYLLEFLPLVILRKISEVVGAEVLRKHNLVFRVLDRKYECNEEIVVAEGNGFFSHEILLRDFPPLHGFSRGNPYI